MRIPDTAVAQAAADLVLSTSTQSLYNHCLRTYLFAALSFVKAGRAFDEELTFLACTLHDLGLVREFMSPDQRFEVDGADAALELLERFGVPTQRAEVVWDAIALHTSLGIVTRKAPEVASASIGAAADLAGLGLLELAGQDVAAVLAAYPRLGFKKSVLELIVQYCQRKPFSLLMHPLEGLARRNVPFFPLPTLETLVRLAPFAE